MTLLYKKIFLLISGIILLSDQLSKFFIRSNVDLFERVNVIKGFFQITHTQNSGAVWGLFSRHPSQIIPKIITILSIIAIFFVFYFFLKVESKCHLELTSLSFIIGGALGNIIDRIHQGYVIDFLDFYIKDLHWPTFNIADLFITTGVIILAFSIWKGKCPILKQK